MQKFKALEDNPAVAESMSRSELERSLAWLRAQTKVHV